MCLKTVIWLVDSRSSASSVHFAHEETAVELVTLADCPLALKKTRTLVRRHTQATREEGVLVDRPFCCSFFAPFSCRCNAFFGRVLCAIHKNDNVETKT
jgi:hypothetical protein